MWQRIPIVTKNLLIINFLMLLASEAIPAINRPLAAYYPGSQNFQVWQIITHMFMHSGFTHFLWNMLGVLVFGSRLEMQWGPKKFLNYYLLCGLGSYILYSVGSYLEIRHLVSMLSPSTVQTVLTEGRDLLLTGYNYTNPIQNALNSQLNGALVGASGCVFGVSIGFGYLYPKAEIQLLIFPIPIRALILILIFFVQEIIAIFIDNQDDNVAHLAHIGGFLIGLVILKIWEKQNKLYS